MLRDKEGEPVRLWRTDTDSVPRSGKYSAVEYAVSVHEA
jgi:hypothetical protein